MFGMRFGVGRYGRCEGHRGFGYGGGMFGHRGRMKGGLRLGRMFEQGDLRLVILHLLAEKPRHGYEIIKAVEERLGGMYSPSPGVVYPTLTLLEELGYASIAAMEGGKKLYTITEAGTEFLQSNRAAVDAILARMDAVHHAYGGGPAPEILRAVHNLQLVLSVRLGRGPLTAEQIRKISELIDAAATEIGRT
jgi:DNA-binding PadR family transcriptional regulator